MKEISFAIVGVGNIGAKYAKLLSGFGDVKLVAAVDIDFNKIVLIIEADSEEIANNTRKGITDIRMWELVNDSENNGL